MFVIPNVLLKCTEINLVRDEGNTQVISVHLKGDQRKMTKQAYKFCFCFRRMFKLRMAEPPEDIVNMFSQYSDNGVMTIERLHKFLVEFQGEEKATFDDAQAILDSLKHLHVFPRRGLHIDAFFRYLFSDLNPPLPPLGV